MGNDSTNSLGSTRNLNSALREINKSSEKLSSGKRINKASDDPAGLAIAVSLASDAAVYKQASNNVNYGQSLISIQDGALQQIGDIGARMKELSTEAANGTYSDSQRAALDQEYQALSAEAQRIAASTEFNGQNVFSGESTTLQVGADASSGSQISIPGSNIGSLVSGVSSQSIATQAGAQAALGATDDFVKQVSSSRGQLGAVSSRLDTAQQNIDVAAENIRSAESRIRDVDVAEEAAKQVGFKIKAQTSIATAAQANLSAANVLKLLR